MSLGIVASLTGENPSVKELYQSWQKLYWTDRDSGSVVLLQMCIDLTGYKYRMVSEEPENIENWADFVTNKILKADYEEVSIIADSTVQSALHKFLELLIVQDRRQLLQDNIWMVRMIKLMVGFCESNDDVCKMIAGYLSALILAHVAVVREHFEKSAKHEPERSSEQDQESHQRKKFLRRTEKLLLRNSVEGFSYSMTLPLIADIICKLFEAYPNVYVLDWSFLKVFEILLQHRHLKTFSRVAVCLLELLDDEKQSEVVIETVAAFFVECLGGKCVRAMVNYKSHERHVMAIVSILQKKSIGEPIFDEAVSEVIRQHMFHRDKAIRDYALDFHAYSMCTPDESPEMRNKMLLSILHLYSKYDHSEQSLKVLITDMWSLDFFQDFQFLFDLLHEQLAINEKLFISMSLVYVIKICFKLLTDELQQNNSTQSVNRPHLQKILKTFCHQYPEALETFGSSAHDRVYLSLLSLANAKFLFQLDRDKIIEHFLANLLCALEKTAKTAKNFDVLHGTLATIRTYRNIVVDVDCMWTELLSTYFGELCDQRSSFTSRNIGKDDTLIGDYVVSLSRMAAFLELDTSFDEHMPVMLKIVTNDFRLLEKIGFSKSETAIFYRLYKCVLAGLVRMLHRSDGNKNSSSETSVDASLYVAVQPFVGAKLKKRSSDLLHVLIKQLKQYKDSLADSVHMFISLCDCLLLFQPKINDLGVEGLEGTGYNVKTPLLAMMAKYLLNYLFAIQYDWSENAAYKQKQLLDKYIQFYSMHHSLPQVTDTHYIIANYSEETRFEKGIEHLMVAIHRRDPSGFAEVICKAAFMLLQQYMSETSLKRFFIKFKLFATTKLAGDESVKVNIVNVFSEVVEKILKHWMDTAVDANHGEMLKLIEPVLIHVPEDKRLTFEPLLRNHAEYENISEIQRKSVHRFIKKFCRSN
ncbi:uncharacterized protein LOC129759065 [Uranotaenia lowii]|uniref:uncharacterized protein LOC129759065 n=1 Tax=Uranotaenia lowii TaxID=190385 RepID=UPI00247B1FF7|nr:uncharacterized protein LOC129759065 [Uranotaenia lowii]